MDFELILDGRVELAETPIWDSRIGKLYWTDLFAGVVHQFDPESGDCLTFGGGGLIGSAVPCMDSGKLLCALDTGIYLLDMKDGSRELVADPNNGNAQNRYNDTRVDKAGRIFTSTVSKKYGTEEYEPDMLGDFYMIDRDGTVKIICEGINQFNGIVWNKDNTKMFVIDTYHERLLEYPYDLELGPIGEGREVLSFKGVQGMPDGMSIDIEDRLYICHWTGKISVWDHSYTHIEDIPVPVEYACCTGFGGEDMTDLYVATSKYCYGPKELEKNPGAGGIFKGKVSVPGRADNYYPNQM